MFSSGFRFKDIQTNQSLCKEGVCLILDKMTERKKSEWHLILLRQRNLCTLGKLRYKENLAVRHINIQLTYLHMHTHVHEKSCFCFVKTLSIASFVHTHIVQTHRYTQINSYAALVIQDILYPVSKEEQIKWSIPKIGVFSLEGWFF